MEPKKDNAFECSAVTRWIEIELTNYCWLDCKVCVRKQAPEYHFMNFETFSWIVATIKDKWYDEIMVCGLWDAFLHKDLEKFIDYLFKELPKINLFFMTKGQAIKESHLAYLKQKKDEWFNVSLTFSVFSLNEKLFNYLTWGTFYKRFMQVLKRCEELKLNYSMEFMLSMINLKELPIFKSFAEKLGKDYWISLVHNWWWMLPENIHKSLFDEEKLKWFYIKRLPSDICEVMKYDYLYFSAKWEVFQCSLNELDRSGYLWKLWEYTLEEFLEKKRRISYKKACEKCFYYNYKTFN